MPRETTYNEDGQRHGTRTRMRRPNNPGGVLRVHAGRTGGTANTLFRKPTSARSGHRLSLLLEKVKTAADACRCGKHHAVAVDEIAIVQGALSLGVDYIARRREQPAVLVMDRATRRAAGEMLESLLRRRGIEWVTVLLEPGAGGEVVADEATVMQVLTEAPLSAELFAAVGAGTVHDIVRFAACQRGKPFVSFPTAASVDGFASAGAPLILRGVKRTLQLRPPVALFADPQVFAAAPREMSAAGFADMLGKVTSLADWELSRLIADEPYCPAGAQLTREALAAALAAAEGIARGEVPAITELMNALVLSGLSMLLIDHSRPASGGEHHLSHYWEMAFLREGRRQILHGAKVGVATAIIAETYRALSGEGLRNRLRPAAGAEGREQAERAIRHAEEIERILGALPEPEEIRAKLRAVGGPSLPGDIGLVPELVQEALRHAHRLRERHTGLWLRNELAVGAGG